MLTELHLDLIGCSFYLENMIAILVVYVGLLTAQILQWGAGSGGLKLWLETLVFWGNEVKIISLS